MTVISTQWSPLRSVTSLGAIWCLLIFAGGPQTAWSQDQPQELQQQDLQGIIPDYVPDGLGEGDFDQLKGNWADWSDETGRLVTDFYASEDDEVRGRRQTLEQIQGKLKTMDRALSDSRYLPIYGSLADLNGRLSRRMSVADALLDTVAGDITAPSSAQVSSAMSKLASDARSLRSNLQSFNGGQNWVDYLQLDDIDSASGQADVSPETVAIIDSTYEKLQDDGSFNDEQQSFLSRPPVQRFESTLDKTARLLSLETPEQSRQELRDLGASLMDAIEEYEGDPTTGNAEQLRRTYDQIRNLAPGRASALTAAMRKHYLNYNLRLVVDESLARDLVRDTQMDSGFINEMVSRAHVTGCQWTNATVNFDLVPSNNGVRFDLLLNGNVRSTATGSTHLAKVHTSGQFHFNGRKQVHFDGDHFTTWPASVGVGGGNRPYAARTKFSWIPLLGRIAENAALREAGSPENSQYARNKVYQEARSQFDRETADMLGRAEQQLESDITGPLRRGGYYPGVKQLSSTDSEIRLKSRLMESGEVGGGETLPLPIYPAHGALVQIHESLLNQVGDRLDLDGKRFTPEGLEQYLKNEIEQIIKRPVDLSGLTIAGTEDGDSPQVEEIVFHDSDALRFRVTGGEVVLNLSMGLKLEDREEIEPQRITVPLQFSLADGKVRMERGTVGVSPIGAVAPQDRTQQITRAGVMRQKIQEAFEPREFDSTFDLSFEEKVLVLRATDLRARSGWLSVVLTDGINNMGSPSWPTPVQQVRVTSSQQLR